MMRIVYVLIATSGFLLGALLYRNVRKKLLFYWGLTTVYALLGYLLGNL